MIVNGMIHRWVVSPFSVTNTYICAGSNNGQRQVGYHNDGAKGPRFKFSEWCVFPFSDDRSPASESSYSRNADFLEQVLLYNWLRRGVSESAWKS